MVTMEMASLVPVCVTILNIYQAISIYLAIQYFGDPNSSCTGTTCTCNAGFTGSGSSCIGKFDWGKSVKVLPTLV